MGRKDIGQSDFFESKERFADIFNGVFFQGKKVIKEEELEEADSVIVSEVGKQPVKLIADKVRKWKGTYVSLLIQENQSFIDYGMVLRVMKEEAATYDKQRKQGYQECLSAGEQPDNNEKMSGMMKNQELLPVITLVLYLGDEKKWDGKKQLYDFFMLPGEIKPFVQNYKINLYDYHEHKDFSNFKTENRMLLELLSLSNNKEKIKKIMEQEEYNFCEDREVAKAIFGILGIEGSVKKYYDKKQGGYDMCKGMREWAEELREEGMEEGLKQGMEKGMEQGIEEGLKQGMEKGIEKGFTSSIKALLEKGYMKKEISNLLDLDMEYVTRLMEGIVVKKVN